MARRTEASHPNAATALAHHVWQLQQDRPDLDPLRARRRAPYRRLRFRVPRGIVPPRLGH